MDPRATVPDFTDLPAGDDSSRIDVGFSLEVSGFADVKVSRSIALVVAGDDLGEAQARLARRLDQEHAAVQQIGHWLLCIAGWKKSFQGEIDALRVQDVAMHLDLESDAAQLIVTFRAEYLGGHLKPLVHAVSFPVVGDVPSDEEMIRRLDQEWVILKRIFTLAQAAGDGLVTRAMPRPFVETSQRPDVPGAGPSVQPLARVATPEEAKRLTERYLDNFRFPVEVEENGVRYGFIPRVEICEEGEAIRLAVTMLMPPAGVGHATFVKGGFMSVELPLQEFYVRGDELNRRTQEGILGIIKGLCRKIGREKGMTRDVDITRPR